MSLIEPQKTSSNAKKIVIPIAVAALLVLIIIGIFVYQQNQTTTDTMMTETPVNQNIQSSPSTATSMYKDGTYQATGNYVSPGGPREIGVTVTISNGQITDSQFEGKATDATSKRFQGEFGNNYKTFVIGKNIDEVMLTKVSGSSLTPKGFDDALNKIKQQAKV